METKDANYFVPEEGLKGKIKQKWHHAKTKMINACDKILETAMKHPAETVAVLTATAAVSKKVIQYEKVRAEERRRDCEFYDPRTGIYAKSRRPLTETEKREMTRRHDNNKEFYGDILYDMGLSKK